MSRKIAIVAVAAALVGALSLGIYQFAAPRPPALIAPASEKPIAAATRPAAVSQPAAAPVAALPSSLHFLRLDTETGQDQPEACLQFSAPLSTADATHYQDYLRLEPPAKITLRVLGDRLCIGGLSFGQDHKATLAAGLPAADGLRLTQAETVPISFGDRPPLVSFAGNGFILPRQGSSGLALETVNVDKVKVTVARVGDRILARSAFGRNSAGDSAYADYLLQSDRRELASPIWSGEMRIAAVHNQRVTTLLPIARLISPRRPGAYLVTATSAAAEQSAISHYRQHGSVTQWVIDTDLALTTMQGADGLSVFVRSLETAKPVGNARVTLIAANNDELGSSVTDADGRAQFAPGLTRGNGAEAPKMVMAYGADDDFAALDLARPAFDLTDRGVGGRPAPGPVDAYSFTDRGVYRPGETVQLVTLLRDGLGAAIEDTPLTLTLIRPDGVQAKRVRLEPQPAGGFALPFALSPTAARGIWTATASIDGGRHAVGRVEFDVEDFVPQKLKVTVETAARRLRPGQPIGLDILGRYLYGAPAANLASEGELRLLVDDDPFPMAKGYRFGLATERFKPVQQPLTIGKTDTEGKVAATVDLAAAPNTSLPLKAEITVGMFEPGGRVVREQLTLPVETGSLALGIRPRFERGQVAEGSEAAFDLIGLDPAGNRVARQGLAYSFIEELWDYDWYFSNGTWHYQNIVRDRNLSDGTIDLGTDKPAQLSQIVPWGHYRLLVTDKQSGAATSVRFNAGWGTGETLDTPDTVEVAPSLGAVKPGGAVQVTIRPPFAGEVQIAVATDRLIETRTLSVSAAGATIDVTAKPEWGAGAYVLATLYRPQAAVKQHEPTRAIGLAWIGLDQSAHTLGVEIAATDVTRPDTTVNLPVKISGIGKGETAYLTLAAIDEGILQLTHFESPDPTRHYFGKRRLAMNIRDDYARLLDGRSGVVGLLRQGGDAAGGEGLSVVPTRTVALFTGPLTVGDAGTVTVPLVLPSFNGQLRLMAVAYSRHGLGKAEARITVRDPLVAELILPRFLAPADRATASLLLHNVAGAAGTYQVTLKASGAVALADSLPPTFDLAAGAQQLAAVALNAGDPGNARFDLTVTGPGGLKIERVWEIQVRTPRFPITLEQTALQAANESYRVTPQLFDAFLPGSATLSVDFASFKGIDVAGLLQSLDRYPFGCSEQITSRALPLVLYDDAARGTGLASETELRTQMQTAINTLLERQDSGGSFGLWRVGDGNARPFLGAYVVDFLARAKDHGLVVPDHALELAYRSMAAVTRGGGNYDYESYRRNSRTDYDNIAQSGAAYAYYVLARAKRSEIGELRYFFDRNLPHLHSAMAMAQIGAALALSGDQARAVQAFKAARDAAGLQPGWDYYATPLRDLAGTVALAAETQQTALLPDLVARLGQYETRSELTHTQEKAWLLLAARAMIKASGPLDIAVNDAAAMPLAQPAAFRPYAAAIARGYTVTNRGQGSIWRTLVVHGTPKLPPSRTGAGMTIDKRITALDGSPVDLSQLRQNDRLLVALSGMATDQAYHQSILVDMLPAGLEIETVLSRGRDGTAAGYEWLSDLSQLRSREARDDRFVAAFDLQAAQPNVQNDNEPRPLGERFNLAYVVRAVTPGSFVLPAAVVEDMYRPGVMARTGEAQITILPR